MQSPVKKSAGVEVLKTSEQAGRTSVSFFVTGRPIPKGRPRFNTKTGNAYTPATTVEWETTVGWTAKAAMAAKGRLLGTLSARLTFYGARANADIDNLIKAVLDGCNRIVYADDKQVMFVDAERSDEKHRTGVLIEIKEL